MVTPYQFSTVCESVLKNYVARTYLGVGYLFVIMSKVINALLRADFGTPTNI